MPQLIFQGVPIDINASTTLEYLHTKFREKMTDIQVNEWIKVSIGKKGGKAADAVEVIFAMSTTTLAGKIGKFIDFEGVSKYTAIFKMKGGDSGSC